MAGDGTTTTLSRLLKTSRRCVDRIHRGGFLWMNKAGDVDMGGLAHIVGNPWGVEPPGGAGRSL